MCDHGHPLVELKSPWDWPGFDIVSLSTSVSDMFQRALFIADDGTPDEITRFENAFKSARSDATIARLEDAIDGHRVNMTARLPQTTCNGHLASHGSRIASII